MLDAICTLCREGRVLWEIAWLRRAGNCGTAVGGFLLQSGRPRTTMTSTTSRMVEAA
jgi:hypothetical protein